MSDHERAAAVSRETSETTIDLTLAIDGDGDSEVDTGIGFFDHMLSSFAKHGLFDLTVNCDGDTGSTTTTRSRTWRSASARRSTRRSATSAASGGTPTDASPRRSGRERRRRRSGSAVLRVLR